MGLTIMKKLLSLSVLFLFFLSGCTSKPIPNEMSSDDVITNMAESDTAIASSESVPETVQTSITTEEIITTQMTTEVSVIPDVIPDDGQLVRILDYIPDAVIDLRYATTNNFTGVVLYDDPEAYLCYGTVKKLMQVQETLREKGYRIMIWDAYRSPEAQWKLWEAYPDPSFVANPRNGLTSHSKGNTIDISIVYEDGSPVELPSAFDEFSAAADRNYSDVSEAAKKNALLLESIMYENGFTGYKGEWWDYSDTETYTLIEVADETTGNGDDYITTILTENEYTFSDISESSQLIIVDSYGAECDVYCYEKTMAIGNHILNHRVF